MQVSSRLLFNSIVSNVLRLRVYRIDDKMINEHEKSIEGELAGKTEIPHDLTLHQTQAIMVRCSLLTTSVIAWILLASS
jgi:hypothetical protein